MQVQVGNTVYPLIAGLPIPFTVGDTIKVLYSFEYELPEQTDVRVWASLYRYTAALLDRSSNAQNKITVTLEEALGKETYQGEIDIVIGSIGSGLWGLIVELPDYAVDDHIDDCLEVTAAPSIMDMIGPLLVIGLMAAMVSMMAPMMKEV